MQEQERTFLKGLGFVNLSLIINTGQNPKNPQKSMISFMQRIVQDIWNILVYVDMIVT